MRDKHLELFPVNFGVRIPLKGEGIVTSTSISQGYDSLSTRVGMI